MCWRYFQTLFLHQAYCIKSLAVLKEVGLVAAEEKGNQRIYQLNPPVFEGAMMGFLGDFGMVCREKARSKNRPAKGNIALSANFC